MSDDAKRRRGKQRAEHFANGGDLRSWRGRSAVFKDRKKEADRKAARKKVDRDD